MNSRVLSQGLGNTHNITFLAKGANLHDNVYKQKRNMGSDFDSLNPWLHGVDFGTNGIHSRLEMSMFLSSVGTGFLLTDLIITFIVKRTKKTIR